MTAFRKTLASVVAAGVIAGSAIFGATGAANANGYGYYSQGNGYYYKCHYISVPYKWDYYGNPIAWRKVKHCS